MRKHARDVVGCCLGILLFSHASVALPTDDGKRDYARQLLDLTGMQYQLSLIPDAIQSGFQDMDEEFSASQKRRLEEQVELAFEQNRLEEVVMATFVSELSEAELLGVINWYQAGLGEKISELETARSNLTSQTQRDRFYQNLAQDPPDSDRVSALTELDHAWKATDASVSLMLDMQVAVSAAIMSGLPASEHLPLTDLIESAENQREMLVQHYTSETLLSMLYVYEDLTLAEIYDYQRFAMTEHGQHFVDAVNLALHKAMLEGSFALGQSLGDLMGELNEWVM